MNEGNVRFGDLPLQSFVDRLASAAPVPGGGSASAVAAALAAGLLAMVARLSQGRPKYAAYQEVHERVLTVADASRARFLELADEDAAAYAAYAAARKMPRETPAQQAERDAAVRHAAGEAARVPMEIVHECRRVAAEVEALAGRSNLNAASDVEVAALLIEAATRGAGANVLINVDAIGDAEAAEQITAELVAHMQAVEELTARAREAIGTGHLREPERA